MYVDSMCLFIRLMTSLAQLNGSLTDIVTSRGQFCHLSVTNVHMGYYYICFAKVHLWLVNFVLLYLLLTKLDIMLPV